jgi:hypothetical protein
MHKIQEIRENSYFPTVPILLYHQNNLKKECKSRKQRYAEIFSFEEHLKESSKETRN